MADACARAFDATGDARWAELWRSRPRWFLGRNDTGVELFDRSTGGCSDGLDARDATATRARSRHSR